MNHTNFPELDLLKLFRGVCVALEQLHYHKLSGVRRQQPQSRQMGMQVNGTAEGGGEMDPLMEEELAAAEEGEEVGDVVPYAHRDIKPGTPSGSRARPLY